jgi:hypothetical protein
MGYEQSIAKRKVNRRSGMPPIAKPDGVNSASYSRVYYGNSSDSGMGFNRVRHQKWPHWLVRSLAVPAAWWSSVAAEPLATRAFHIAP